jgi:hypothetical protein
VPTVRTLTPQNHMKISDIIYTLIAAGLLLILAIGIMGAY